MKRVKDLFTASDNKFVASGIEAYIRGDILQLSMIPMSYLFEYRIKLACEKNEILANMKIEEGCLERIKEITARTLAGTDVNVDEVITDIKVKLIKGIVTYECIKRTEEFYRSIDESGQDVINISDKIVVSEENICPEDFERILSIFNIDHITYNKYK